MPQSGLSHLGFTVIDDLINKKMIIIIFFYFIKTLIYKPSELKTCQNYVIILTII
ncbi:phosphoribosylformylglycinamidine cyclo-ligase [Streptococcus parauberis]|nr:phosphoribosylformylglycinamidine cyclo-ligase [Streptococcus parauberis]